ncbi:Glyoxalase-like domain protein [Planctomycetes bacterium Pan216]|uniref:Glyoxalase-like domain protein n=1 Tax=Kolteria novifilia TaxID=2527975 RepID=A0A518AZS2_9BACT|nr:Glyoxalase-like domain protein [Planctomycetes bacterium Pan216]
MSETTTRPSQMPWITPYLTVRDAAESMEFYEKAFGFSAGSTPMKDESGSVLHGEMSYRDQIVVMVGPSGAFGNPAKAPVDSVPSPVGLYVYCADADAMHERAVEAGCQSLFPPTDMFWRDRCFAVLDPDGHRWTFATHLGPSTGQEEVG